MQHTQLLALARSCERLLLTMVRMQCTFFEQFDADGDGNIDLDEFRAMIRTSREVSCRPLPVAII